MGLYSLPRTARLLKAGDFAALRGKSRRISARHFLAEYSPNDQANSRLGQAVSRRVSSAPSTATVSSAWCAKAIAMCAANWPAWTSC